MPNPLKHKRMREHMAKAKATGKTFNTAEWQVLEHWPVKFDKVTSAKGTPRNVAVKSDGFDLPGGAAAYMGVARFKGKTAEEIAKAAQTGVRYVVAVHVQPTGKA